MSFMPDMPEFCRERATRPEHALELIDCVRREFDKGFDGHGFSPSYVLEKLASLTRHVEWLDRVCEARMAEEFEDEDDEDDEDGDE